MNALRRARNALDDSQMDLAPMATDARIETRPMAATEADLERLRRLFESNADPKDLRTLRWRYLQNPTGQVFVDFGVSGDRVAGVYCVSPVHLKVGAQVALGVQSIDTLTDADFRGRGVFRLLAERTYQRCTDAGARLVYGFPNGSSAFGFFERLGWTRLDPVPFLVRPLRLGYALRKLPRLRERLPKALPDPALFANPPKLSTGQELRVVLEPDEEFDALWAAFARDIPIAVHRDAGYLRWRFFDNPSAAYKTLGLYDRGQLIGYVIHRVADKHGGRIGYVMELMHRPGAVEDGRALLQAALSEIALAGGELALAWCLPHAPNAAAHRLAGFAPLPVPLRPIELHFGARHLATSNAPVGNRESWYLSYADSDTV